MYQKLKRAQRWWGNTARVLIKMGATVRYHGMMYKAVAQLVLLYNCDNWVVMGAMLKVLEGLHHWVTRHITGMTETRGAVRYCEYPLLLWGTGSRGTKPHNKVHKEVIDGHSRKCGVLPKL